MKPSVDLPGLKASIISHVVKSQRAALDLGARLLIALQQALQERRLDVADAILLAIELCDAGGECETASAYRLVSDAADDALRPRSREPRGH